MKLNMRILLISHAYSAPYNRRDKLARLAQRSEVWLGAIFPNNWFDRQLKIDRSYKAIPEGQAYQSFPLKTFLPGFDLWYFYKPLAFFKTVKNFQPDIIHLEQEPFSLSAFQAVFFNKLFWRKKIILFTWENLDRRLNFLQRFFRWFVLQHVDFVMGGNREAVRLVKRYGFAGATTVIPQFGVDERRFHPIDVMYLRRKLDLENKFVIGFVGRLVSEKGIDTLIQAVKFLKQRSYPSYKSYTLLILSSMAPPPELKKRAEGLGDQVKFIGKIPHEEFPQYMNLFDVLVLPSVATPTWKEQFGRVMIEAMACGVPVIGSSSGAIPEVIDDAGLVFTEGDTNNLTEKILQLMTNQKLHQRLSQKSLQRALTHYTHDKVIDQTNKIYQHLGVK